MGRPLIRLRQGYGVTGFADFTRYGANKGGVDGCRIETIRLANEC